MSAKPSISSLSVTSGPVGTPVTITGTNFGSPQGTSTVTFNGVPAIATSWSATSIIVTVPLMATTGNVVVTVSGSSNGVAFTVTAPAIASLSQTQGFVGQSVTIAGTNFGATQGTSVVSFNGVPATPTSWSAASIGVTVPTGATTGNITVTVGALTSNGQSFTVLPIPVLSTILPIFGAVGTPVVLTGNNFGSSQGTSTVTIAGAASAVVSCSATSITITVPLAAQTGNIVLTVGGMSFVGIPFVIVPALAMSQPPIPPAVSRQGTPLCFSCRRGMHITDDRGNDYVYCSFNGGQNICAVVLKCNAFVQATSGETPLE